MNPDILLLEPHDRLRASLRDGIEVAHPGITILEADDAAEALRLLAAAPPRAVLVDLDTMGPGKLDDVRRIKTVAPEALLAVLALEGFPIQRRAVREAGADAYVRKGMIDEDLLPLLEELFGPGESRTIEWTVVCIEDELDMIRLIELALERGPFRVFGAVSGRQGLDLTRRLKPDVVLLDLMMPGMDGWEVCRRMRANEALRDIPIIAVTVVEAEGRRAVELEVDDYVTKPFAPGDLMRRVRAAARA